MSRNEYSEVVNFLNIKKGDMLDISSDLFSLFFYFKRRGIKFDSQILMEVIEEKIGQEGTILIRTFNWDFCHGKEFNVKTTPSQVGELGNIFLNRDDYRRTRHPIYSWMVKGKYMQKLCDLDNTCSFGKGSPWDFFEKKNAKMIILGNTRALGLTCLHHIEQELQMPYRYEKNFEALYTDEKGITEKKIYSMYVRKLDRQVLFDDKNVRMNLIQNDLMDERLLDGYLKIATLNYKDVYNRIHSDLSTGHIEDWVIIKPLEEQ